MNWRQVCAGIFAVSAAIAVVLLLVAAYVAIWSTPDPWWAEPLAQTAGLHVVVAVVALFMWGWP